MSTTTERKISVASGLGDADASQVMAGSTFSSESGFSQEGKFIPSADNITYNNATSKLGSTNTQGAIDEIVTLTNESGHSIDVTLNKSTYVMAISLKDKNGEVLNEKTVDFPMETAFVNASYDKASKTMKFTLESGSTVDVPLGDLVEGLVSQTDFNVLSGEVQTLKTDVNNNTNAISEIKTNLDVNVLIGKYPDTQTVQNVTFTKISDGKYTVVGTNSKTWGAQLRCKNFKALANVEYIVNVTGDSSLCYIGADTDISLGRKTNGSVLKFDSDTLVNIYIAAAGSATVDSTIEFSVITKNVGIEIDILTEDVSAINSNMSDYGLNNVFDGVWNQDTDGGKVISNYYSVNSGDTIRIENCSGDAVVLLYNSSKQWQSNIYNAVENVVVIPSDISYFRILLSSSVALTPTTADKIRLYINNQIDVVKNSIQSGQNFSSTSSGTVTFPIPYKSIPNVVCTIITPTINTNSVIVKITNITEKKFDYITVKDNELNNDNTIQWISMGEL